MTRLERNLFEAAENSLNQWGRLMRVGWDEYGVNGQKGPEWLWNSIEKENAKFKELLGVIRDCGLEDEFHIWREREDVLR